MCAVSSEGVSRESTRTCSTCDSAREEDVFTDRLSAMTVVFILSILDKGHLMFHKNENLSLEIGSTLAVGSRFRLIRLV